MPSIVLGPTEVEVTNPVPPIVTVLVPADQLNLIVPVGGPVGPQGPPGAGGDYYLHTQAIASADWAIVHGFGHPPNVQVIVGTEVIGVPITHTDTNTAHAVFATPQTGKAVCS